MRILDKLLLLLAAVLLLLICWQPPDAGCDFWAHASVGRWIYEHRQVPHSSLFLWTYNGPWLAHSWLAELGSYLLMQIGGEMGGPVLAATLTVLVVLTAFALSLWPIIRERGLPPLPALLVICATFASVDRLLPRPELFTTLFMAIVCRMILDYRSADEPRKAIRRIWLLPALFALWTNLHGAVAFGLVILWAAAVADYAQFRDRQAGSLIKIVACSTAAIVINPYGIHYLAAYAPLTNHSFYYIPEWKPFWKAPVLETRVPISELIIAVCAAVAWALAPRRRWCGMAWLIVTVAAFLQARRNMDLLALTGLFVFSAHYAEAMKSGVMAKILKLRETRSLSVSYGTFTALVTCYSAYLLIMFCISMAHSPFVSTLQFSVPRQQASFIADKLGGNVRLLNLYNQAAYLEWRLGDHSASFYIDGLNAYPLSVYDDYNDIWNATPRGLRLLESGKINCIAGVPLVDHIGPRLYGYLEHNAEWKIVYAGWDGPVFVHDTSSRARSASAAPARAKAVS